MGFVQSAHNTAASSSSLAITLASAPTAGNCLFGMAGNNDSSSDSVTSFKTGTSADNWASAVSRSVTGTDGAGGAIWSNQDLTVTTTVINVAMGSSGANLGYVIEWAGVAETGALDKTNSAAISSSTSWSSGSSGTLTNATEVAIGFTSNFTESATPTITGPGSPWTNLSSLNVASEVIGLGGYQAVSATTALTYNGTTTGTIFNGVAMIATFTLSSTVNVNLPVILTASNVPALPPPVYVALPLVLTTDNVPAVSPGSPLFVNLTLLQTTSNVDAYTPHVAPSVNLPTVRTGGAVGAFTPEEVQTLVISITSIATTDPLLGDPVFEGFSNYQAGFTYFACNVSVGAITFYSAPTAVGPWTNQGTLEVDDVGDLLADFANVVFSGNTEVEGQGEFGSFTEIDAGGVSIGNGSSAQLVLNPQIATPANFAAVQAQTATLAQTQACLAGIITSMMNRGMVNP